MFLEGDNNLKVTAYLKARTPVVVVDVPADKCNLMEFMPYIKSEVLRKLYNGSINDYIKVKFELGDSFANSK